MSFYVPTETWIDDDGDLIEAGKTFVVRDADCFKKWPGRWKAQTMLRHTLNSGVEPIGAVTTLGYRDVKLLERYVDYRVSLWWFGP